MAQGVEEPAPSRKGESGWQTTGHRWLSKGVLRVFGEQQVGGVATDWMPPNPQDASEPVLFHVKHDDGMHAFNLLVVIVLGSGDEEDLDVQGAAAAIQACQDVNGQTPNSHQLTNPSSYSTCDYCGRVLRNAGNKTNHQKACAMKPGYVPPASQLLAAVTKPPVEQKAHCSGLSCSCDFCNRGLANVGSKVNHEKACKSNPESSNYIDGVCTYSLLLCRLCWLQAVRKPWMATTQLQLRHAESVQTLHQNTNARRFPQATKESQNQMMVHFGRVLIETERSTNLEFTQLQQRPR